MQANLPMTVARQCERHITSRTAMRTEAIGAALGAFLAPGDVVCLSGELGAGKTAFSRGIGAGWGASAPLSSPTYNLVHERGRSADNTRLYHLDFYRVSGARDAETLGIDDILDSGNVVIFEWPERILDLLPAERLWIDFTVRQDDTRVLEFVARGDRYRSLIDALSGKLQWTR
ncbi:MAG: tRNA (adenosine(37)-N6)-threonylcarbamoyltransferase complex ATPase subunit type 1 TsaE [Chloroflexi bacterium]|nr:tRNA (adenosine(37)-N6)-threonylcarbamoyltransferase complex ATPase subunit type 1 TsaE [Chloroflexota bacterium]